MFLNLLFKALKEDIDLRRMAAFAKRLTQVIYVLFNVTIHFHAYYHTCSLWQYMFDYHIVVNVDSSFLPHRH